MEQRIKLFNHSSEQMPEISTESVDLILTSPPYNINTNYDTHRDSCNLSGYIDFISKVIGECSRVLKPEGIMVINIPEFAKNSETLIYLPKIYENICHRFLLHKTGIAFWVKTNNEGFLDPSTKWSSECVAQTESIHSVTEWLFFFSKTKFDGIFGKVYFGARNPDKKDHPAAWPKWLPMRIIEQFSEVGQIVLDPFMGVGTTGEACAELVRNFIGYEISSQYLEVARKKLTYNF